MKRTAVWRVYLIIIVAQLMNVPAFSSESFGMRLRDSFSLFPEYHVSADMKRFFLQKNGYFSTRYFMEANVMLDFLVLGYKDILYTAFDIEIRTGMGRTPGNIVFDPMDASYGLIPVWELRLPQVLVFSGLDHRCFHEIDKKETPTVYWNKYFLTVTSPRYRLDRFLSVPQTAGFSFKDRLAWKCMWSYYIQEFFGLVRKSKLTSDEPGYIHDFTGDVRFAVIKRDTWAAALRGKTMLGSRQSPQLYYLQETGVEFLFNRSGFNGVIFITYTRDNVPQYDTKDKLLEAGLRFAM
jgi:hypothetical protein